MYVAPILEWKSFSSSYFSCKHQYTSKLNWNRNQDTRTFESSTNASGLTNLKPSILLIMKLEALPRDVLPDLIMTLT